MPAPSSWKQFASLVLSAHFARRVAGGLRFAVARASEGRAGRISPPPELQTRLRGDTVQSRSRHGGDTLVNGAGMYARGSLPVKDASYSPVKLPSKTCKTARFSERTRAGCEPLAKCSEF